MVEATATCARAGRAAADRGSKHLEHLAIVRRMAGGDETALAELYDALNRLVYGHALRILGDSGAAEDVTLEVFLQVWKSASTYDLSRGTPMAWVMTIARSRSIDRLRSDAQHRRRLTALETDEGHENPSASLAGNAKAHSPYDDASDAERREVVGAALDALLPEQRVVIELAYYGGMSHSEIAEHLSLPLGTVKTRIRLGMSHLRGVLEAHADLVH
jgi:RNA polymerase sigma-70 factor (ECF subfamily)